MDVFLGRNFVSGPRTLKPKKNLKNLKNLKKPKNLKNLKKILKNLGFFQPWVWPPSRVYCPRDLDNSQVDGDYELSTPFSVLSLSP